MKKTKNHTRIQLYSGGLDSLIMWRLLGCPPALYVELGHGYQPHEIKSIMSQRKAYSHLGIHLNVTNDTNWFMGDLEHDDGYIPLRNLILAQAGYLHILGMRTRKNKKMGDPIQVILGGLLGESVKDKSGKFHRDTSRLLTYLHGSKVEVVSPYRNWSKTHLVKKFLELYPHEVPMLLITSSCYQPGEAQRNGCIGCGRCMACFRRWVAMSLNGIHEPHLEQPWSWEVVQPRRLRDAMMKHLIPSRVTEWPGILVNNIYAAAAIRRQRISERKDVL